MIFHNFSPCRTTRIFIQFSFKKAFLKWLYSLESHERVNTIHTRPSNMIIKYTAKRMLSISIVFPTVLVIQKAYRLNASDFSFEVQQWHTRINIASSNFEENGSY